MEAAEPRPPGGVAGGLAIGWGLGGAAFHLYLIFAGLLPNLVTRPVHLALALPWIFLWLRPPGRAARWAGWLLCALGIAACGWVALNRDRLADQYGVVETPFQTALAFLLILVVLEMARRAIKAILPAVAVIALAYALWGEHIPGQFGHPGLPLESILGTLVVAEGGLWGPLTGISVDIVAVFVLLGATVAAGEAGVAFMALATRTAGRFRAGAAKVAVVASALFGSISGSASANVASTGAVTLPAMRRLGYPAPFAAAVEAVASTGGQIMPPLMGAGAFVMVELLQVPYSAIMMAATLPAILFFWTTWAGVDHQARAMGLAGMPADALPPWRDVLATLPFFLLPFGLLVGLLFATDKTPQWAAAVAIGAAAALLLIDRHGRPSLARFARRVATVAVDAGAQTATIAAVIICAGLIVGVLHMTGLGVKVTSVILGLSGGNLWVALVLTGIACLILGMEVPTTAAYVICVSVAGPALEQLGLPPLAAHLFVFWYALLSTITPPVCGTVFIAAGMAEAPWLRVASIAMRLGVGLYLVPLGFVANPALLAPVEAPWPACLAFAKVAAGVWLISAAAQGRGTVPWRIAGAAGGLALLFLFGVAS